MAEIDPRAVPKFHANERLDLEDVDAISTLREDDTREVLKRLYEPGNNGTVVYGFGGTTSGLTFTFTSENGVAVAPDGALLQVATGSPVSLSLAANSISYIHAFLTGQDTATQSRNFLSVVGETRTEVVQSVNTRTARVVDFYVTTAPSGTPSLGGFQTSAVVGGVQRSLVALWACVTTGSSVSSTVDFRRSFLPNGNANLADELPFSFSADPSRGTRGIRSTLRAIASVVREITGETTLKAWWTSPVRSLKSLTNAALLNVVQSWSAQQTFTSPPVFPNGVSGFTTFPQGVEAHSLHSSTTVSSDEGGVFGGDVIVSGDVTAGVVNATDINATGDITASGSVFANEVNAGVTLVAVDATITNNLSVSNNIGANTITANTFTGSLNGDIQVMNVVTITPSSPWAQVVAGPAWYYKDREKRLWIHLEEFYNGNPGLPPDEGGTGQPIFNLPAAYRPSTRQVIICNLGKLIVKPSGDVYVHGSPPAGTPLPGSNPLYANGSIRIP